ncbi:MAG TPA: exodeoxyribonuclease VII large subunit [Flavobacteriaceae bacterium]|nr:exodeoxyribonuclease VII large subunit [Flavobacteriaceae bacterium]
MAEIIEDKQVFSLYEVSRSVKKTLENRYQKSYWIKAEMNKLNYYSHSGHCYPELVEKKDGKVIAQTKSTLWSKDYQRINKSFLKLLQEPLKEGIKILFCAKIAFDPVYGFTLHISDIDPNFTLGDLEREKKETIAKLRKEAAFDTNKQLKFPLLPQRIAVISVETSKGYADFRKVLEMNNWNYKFFYHLFPSLLQGDRAADSMIRQLRKIAEVSDDFDVVAIIRGGGGDVGLSCYNNYELAKEIALFPIPVITGIGHATNETVTELVSFHNAITPTKLAEFLIQKFHNFSVPVMDAEKKISTIARRLLEFEDSRLRNEIKLLYSQTQHLLVRHYSVLRLLKEALKHHATSVCLQETNMIISVLDKIKRAAETNFIRADETILEFKHVLERNAFIELENQAREIQFIQKSVDLLDPENILKRGYTMTLHNGHVLKDLTTIQEKEVIETITKNGKIESIITKICN